MATRYWVGGSGDWNNTARWSTTSGGAGGASIPTSADDVIINGSSGSPAINIAVEAGVPKQCLSLTTTGATCTISGSNFFDIFGNTTLSSSTTFGSFSVIRFRGTGTITTNNASILDVRFTAVGATYTLGSNFPVTYDILLQEGTLTTSASNYSISCDQFIVSSGATITLNGSTLNYKANFEVSTGATVNAGTSSIIGSAAAPAFAGGGKTYNIVSITYTGALSGNAAAVITGANTYTTLTLNNQNPITELTIPSITITGTFTATSNTTQKRLRIITSNYATQRTITAGTTVLSYVDFRAIVGAGTAAWTGTSIGNIGNNSGITFTAATTRYAKAGNSGTGFFVAIGWAATSGGASGASVPLPQDTVYFNSTAAAGDYDARYLICANIDFTGFTTAVDSPTQPIKCYGNITLPNAASDAFNLNIFALSTTTGTISGGQNDATNLTIGDAEHNTSMGTYTLSGTVLFRILSLDYGTLNGGTSTLTLTGSNTSFTAETGFTYNKGSSNIVINSTDLSVTFAGGGLNYPKITLAGSISFQTITFSGNNTIAELASTRTNGIALSFTAGSTTTFGAFTASGTAGNEISIKSTGTITKAILVKSTPWYVGVNSTSTDSTGIILAAGDGIDYLSFTDIAALPGLSSFLVMF